MTGATVAAVAGEAKRKRDADEREAVVREKVQRFKEMVSRREGGEKGARLEAQVQARDWRRARKRKRREESGEATAEAEEATHEVSQSRRRIETSRHTPRTLLVWQHMLDEGIT